MTKKKIIVVDDEPDFAMMISLRLKTAGYSVVVSGDAYSGAREIIRGNYDFILLDLTMPGGGGFSLLENVRKIPSKAFIPAAIMTGRTIDDEIRQKAEEYGISTIFSKPFDDGRFLNEIQMLVPS